MIYNESVLTADIPMLNYQLVIADIPYPSVKVPYKGFTLEQVTLLMYQIKSVISEDATVIFYGKDTDVFVYKEASKRLGETVLPSIGFIPWIKKHSTKNKPYGWKDATEYLIFFNNRKFKTRVTNKYKGTGKDRITIYKSPYHADVNASPLFHTRLFGTHVHEKPGSQIRQLLELYTKEGDNVLDTCAGSGVVLRECKAMNRGYTGYETNEDSSCWNLI